MKNVKFGKCSESFPPDENKLANASTGYSLPRSAVKSGVRGLALPGKYLPPPLPTFNLFADLV